MNKFYNREREISLLKDIEKKSLRTAQMTFVVGRRRIGKTALLRSVFAGEETLYFFVEKKNEILLCEEFTEEIQKKLGITVHGLFRNFKDVFGYLMDISKNRHWPAGSFNGWMKMRF